ncbi:histone acetyltransferase type B catalytic subunit-like [Haliotis rubra]|uniref:histone acetyltransferase type B catalytic subunit-like n=1 Tax=Haliotis rubra TaxID=36100 RepID=UPI001EE57594|nr:histone acetyltransferase type B catalytic subunit-like [Haliotis rubra]
MHLQNTRGSGEKETKMAGMSLLKNKFESFKCSANDVVHFKLVRQESDIFTETTTFKPEMTHQLFGDQESIFGYKDLVVEMYYSACRLSTYINMKYSEKLTPDKIVDSAAISLPPPDNVLPTLTKELPPGFYTSRDEFITSLAKDANFKPFGEKLHSYTVNKDNVNREFEIFKTDIEAPGFREYHDRLQTFILFYIDAASFIDVDDDRWSYYLLFEKYQSNGNPMHAIVGYMTVYNYYAYPEKIRPRISQVLILPPFQKQGHGAQLLQTFYNSCYSSSDVLDITVEDPSENFQRLRDFVDVKNCMELTSFEPDRLYLGFSEDMVIEAQKKLKLSRRQTRRVYEMLRLRATDASNKEMYRQYRLDIKKRLNAPFQKNGRDFKKLEKALQPEELSQTLSCMSLEQRHLYLEKAFQDHVDVYRHILDRVTIGS